MDCFASLAMTRRKTCTHHPRAKPISGWRKAARALALNDVKPSDVPERRGDAPELFELTAPPQNRLKAPQRIGQIRRTGANCDPASQRGRFALLYRLLGGCGKNHDLLDIATDPDVAEVATMAKAYAATSIRCTLLSASRSRPRA
jgi:hypothetical protein